MIRSVTSASSTCLFPKIRVSTSDIFSLYINYQPTVIHDVSFYFVLYPYPSLLHIHLYTHTYFPRRKNLFHRSLPGGSIAVSFLDFYSFVQYSDRHLLGIRFVSFVVSSAGTPFLHLNHKRFFG